MHKFNKELKNEIVKQLAEKSEMFKSSSEEKDGTFEVIITAQTKDRDGDIVLQEGLNTEHFMKNPVVLWVHDYSKLPIGMATELIKNDDGTTTSKGIFASEKMNPFAQQVRKLYDAGLVKTVSIGFIAKEWEGNVITESELLEYSFVPVPSNREAVDIAKSKGLEKEFKSFCENCEVKTEKKEDEKEKPKEIKMECIKSKLEEQSDKLEKLNKSVSELVGKMTLIAKSLETKSEGKSEVAKEIKSETQMIARMISSVNSKLK